MAIARGATGAGQSVICPRCEAIQADAAECAFCGVVIAKAKVAAKPEAAVPVAAPAAEPPRAAKAAPSKQNPVLPLTPVASLVRLSSRQREQLFIQIERMARAAVPLPEALMHAGAVLGGPAERPLQNLAERLAAGAELLSEMQRLPGYFDAIDLAMIAAAQHTGKLPEVAQRLAQRHAHTASLTSQLLGSLAYPAFLVISSLLLSPVQALLTQGVVAYLLDVATSLGTLAAVCFGAWLGLRKVQRAPGRWDALARLEPLPGLGYLLRARRFSLVFDVLAMALQAGLPLSRALELAGAAPAERAMAAAIQKSLQSLRTSPLSASVPFWPGAPAKTKERLAAAERSGHLPEVFAELASEARERLSVGLRRALLLVRGLITAAAIAVVAWSLISQVTKLASDPFAALPGEEGEQLRRELEQALPGLLEKQLK